MTYPAAKKAEKRPLTGSCLPSKFSTLSLSMKNRTPVKNKHPTVFPIAQWSHFFSSCPSVATSPSHTLLCDVGDGTLHPTACSARASGGRREAPRRKDAAPSMSPSFASSPWRRQFLPGVVVGPSIHKPASSLPISEAVLPGQLQPYYGLTCVHKIHLLIP